MTGNVQLINNEKRKYVMSRASRATRSATRPGAGRPTQAKPARKLLIATLAVLAVVAAVVLFLVRGQGGSQGYSVADEGFGHVHGIAVDPGSGALHVATHVGLFRIDDVDTAVRVSKEAPDLMGFTVVGPGHFLASGHPDRHDDGPANLGLIESTDGGVTWKTMSLSGAADFHGLQAAHGAVYGYNSTDGAFMVSTDRQTWQKRSTVAMGAFAVSPTDPESVLAIGRNGLQRSTDGGRTWQVVAGSPELALLAWDQAGQVWAVAPDGAVWQSTDGGGTWQQRGAVNGQPQAIATHGADIFVALTGDRIVASSDGGATWSTRYAPN